MIPSLLLDKGCPSKAQIPRLDLIIRAQTSISKSSGRLGVLGGGYDPITRAHMLLAQSAVEQFDLHEVIFVLSRTPPHKSLFGASIKQRLEMMRIGITGVPYISVGFCTHGLFLEICTALQPVYPHNPELFFITGRDAADRLFSWPYANPAEAIEQMFGAIQLLVFPRHGKLTLPEDPLIQKYRSRIHSVTLPEDLDHISSTRVRQRILAGEAIDELVHADVAAFIQKRKLYEGLPESQPG
jgi:nicotinate-nucleotide adenylyltransferase